MAPAILQASLGATVSKQKSQLEDPPWRGHCPKRPSPGEGSLGDNSEAFVTKRASLGNESESGFMPTDLPTSWASHLALISTGTSASVFESKGLSSGSTCIALGKRINVSELLLPLA